MEIESALQVEIEHRGDYAVLHVAGRADSVASPLMEKAILKLFDEGCTKIVLDFENLEYLSSSGLRVLLMAGKTMQQKEGTLKLACLTENIHDILSVSGFLKLFSVFDSVDDAVA